MSEVNETRLWHRMRSMGNEAKGFADSVSAIEVELLVQEYAHDFDVAPRRHDRGKLYFVGHDGHPSSGAFTNRDEEHLALALFNETLCAPAGDRLRIIDYQVPLKATQSDPAGKIDLVSVLGAETIVLMELKAPRHGRGDSPLKALLEVLSYAAVVQANWVDFLSELQPVRVRDGEVDLAVLVLGPSSWWAEWERVAGDWKQPLAALCASLADALHIQIACGALDPCDASDLSHGLDGARATLSTQPRIIDVTGLPGLRSRRPLTPVAPSSARSYLDSLDADFRRFAENHFSVNQFRVGVEPPGPTPIFTGDYAAGNLLDSGDDALNARILGAITPAARHLHFANMRSSQALTQSVFAGLEASGHLGLLAGVSAECGRPAFGPSVQAASVTLEQGVTTLAEPRPTSVDVWLESPQYRVAVECKLKEAEFGTCSRPRLPADDRSHCDGSYTVQMGRHHRCALTEAGIAYWRYIPQILDWDEDRDHSTCPLGWTYQLVRNILAAAVDPDGSVDAGGGHCLIVYDERNPAFWRGGKARLAADAVLDSLRAPQLLLFVSWQTIAVHIAREPDLAWLAQGLADKYGFAARPPASPATGGSRPHETPAATGRRAPVAGRSSFAGLSFVYVPSFDPVGHLLLSVKGQSYKLRSPRRTDWVPGFELPNLRTLDALVASGLVDHREPVGERHPVQNEIDWWRPRLDEIDRRRLAAPAAGVEDAQD